MLTITPVSGEAITLTDRNIPDPRLQARFTRHTGLQVDNQVTFYFEGSLRARLPELSALAGQNVTQTKNRAGVIQLMSTKPCSFVRFRWDAAKIKGFAQGWNPLYSFAEVEGVFEITDATLDGLTESLALTIYRGDWLWQGGTVERFV